MSKDPDFHPLKHSSSVNVSKSNNQSAIVHKVTIHKSVNSFVAHKLVSVAFCNFIRPDFASNYTCYVPSKPVKCKVACESVFNIFSKSVKSKIACKPVCNVPSKPIKSKVPCKLVSNVPNKLLRSKFTSKPVSNVPFKHGNQPFFVRQLVRSLVNSQVLLSVNLAVLCLIL